MPSKAATKLKVALDCLATAGGDNSTEGGEGSSAGEEDDGAWPTEWLGHGGTGLVCPKDPIPRGVGVPSQPEAFFQPDPPTKLHSTGVLSDGNVGLVGTTCVGVCTTT